MRHPPLQFDGTRTGEAREALMMVEESTIGEGAGSTGEGPGVSATPHKLGPNSEAAAQAAAESAREQDKPVAMIFSQADVDRIVKDRLEREKSAREKAAAKLREDAEADALKKNQEWQTLSQKTEARANELQARVGELEAVGSQVERYKAALEKNLEAEKKDLPKHVLVLLEKLDPVEQLEYLAANREVLGKAGRTSEGVPSTPSPRQRSLSEEDQEAARRSQAAIYQNF